MNPNRFSSIKEKNDRLSRRERASGAKKISSFPAVLKLETTELCNLSCIMCPYHSRHENRGSGKRRMSREVFDRVAEEIFPYIKYWCPTVTGEVFTNSDFFRQVRVAQRYGVRLSVVTNGSLIPRGKNLRLLVKNLHEIVFSVDSHRKEEYERIRPGASFERLRRNIKRVVHETRKLPSEMRPSVSFNSTLMRSNIGDACGLVRMAKDMGASKVSMSPALRASTKKMEKRLDEKESLYFHQMLSLYHILSAQKLADDIGIELDAFSPINQGMSPPDVRGATRLCRFLYREVFVHLDGSVYPCCVRGDNRSKMLLGNIMKESFERIWHGQAYRKLIETFEKGSLRARCRNCYEREKDMLIWKRGTLLP